eukprot:7162128-Prymnesium_polylepis.1
MVHVSVTSTPRPLQYYVDVDIEIIGPYAPAEDYITFTGTAPGSNSTPPQSSHVRLALLRGASEDYGVRPARLLPYFWADADGVLGASHSTVSANPIEYLLQPSGSTFALDLNPGGESRMLLGGTYYGPSALPQPAPPTPEVEWSEVQIRPGYQQLRLFEPAVCGASLLGGLSNHWVAIVDS